MWGKPTRFPALRLETLGWRRMRALREEVPRKLWQTAVRCHDAVVLDNVEVKDEVAAAAVTG